MIEFVPLSDIGRRYSGEFRVRLGDADAHGVLRLDGVARILQDVATDDWEDTGLESTDTWVVRRTTVRVADTGRWPRYKEVLTVTTWCGGTGAAWAERRTNVSVHGQVLVEAVALWVPVDPSGHPVRIKPAFHDVYGEAMQGRKVSGRIATPVVADDAQLLTWPLRRADLDIVGHVNNAAVWQAVTEVVTTPVSWVSVVHHGAVERGHDVQIAHVPGSLWLLVDGEVRVAAEYAE
ncbi:MAG: acyl-ACP thioesterase domain-containing protein [Acidimicrobiales bacterium]